MSFNKPPTPKFKEKQLNAQTPKLYTNKINFNRVHQPSQKTTRTFSNNQTPRRNYTLLQGGQLHGSDKLSRPNQSRTPPNRMHPGSLNPHFPQIKNKTFRSRTPQPSALRIFNDNLEKSYISRTNSEFDSMLSGIRPSRSNSNRSMKYKSEYHPEKRPSKPSLRVRPKARNLGIDLGPDFNWLNAPKKREDSVRGNSFTMPSNKSGGVQLYGRGRFQKNPLSARSGEKREETSVGGTRRVSFRDKPKVFHVENWKILNVDMSKEGKLYSRFNRVKPGKVEGDNCKIF